MRDYYLIKLWVFICHVFAYVFFLWIYGNPTHMDICNFKSPLEQLFTKSLQSCLIKRLRKLCDSVFGTTELRGEPTVIQYSAGTTDISRSQIFQTGLWEQPFSSKFINVSFPRGKAADARSSLLSSIYLRSVEFYPISPTFFCGLKEDKFKSILFAYNSGLFPFIDFCGFWGYHIQCVYLPSR